MERLSEEAERASVKFKQVEFLKDKIGQVFEGVVSGVTEWGMFVEITENKCEGMIRLRDLKGDYFIYDEKNYRIIGKRTGEKYQLGDTVNVLIKKADLLKKQIDMELADEY
jgi:ribonuclease R